MEPLDPATSPWGRWETPCAIHGMGPCPYPVAQRQPVLPSPGMREGEEGVTDVEDVVEVPVAEEDDVVEVTVVEEEDNDGPVEVILVTNPSPLRPTKKQTTRIWIGPRGQPTGTLAPWTGAREAGQISPMTGFEVWPPPPPPPPCRPVTTMSPAPSSGARAPHRHHKILPSQVNNHHSEAPSGAESFTAAPTS
jgi:hypothetical protein